MKCKVFTRKDIILSDKNNRIRALIYEGAPLKIVRKSLTDTSDYTEDDLEYLGEIIVHHRPDGSEIYEWEEI